MCYLEVRRATSDGRCYALAMDENAYRATLTERGRQIAGSHSGRVLTGFLEMLETPATDLGARSVVQDRVPASPEVLSHPGNRVAAAADAGPKRPLIPPSTG